MKGRRWFHSIGYVMSVMETKLQKLIKSRRYSGVFKELIGLQHALLSRTNEQPASLQQVSTSWLDQSRL